MGGIKMNRIYFISDLHLSHNNIIKYCNRPYENIEQMNNDIIKRWNSVVGKDDTVWVLGDVGLGRKEDIKRLLLQFKGHKKLIMGNHDRWTPRSYQECGFEFVAFEELKNIKRCHGDISGKAVTMNDNAEKIHVFKKPD